MRGQVWIMDSTTWIPIRKEEKEGRKKKGFSAT